MSETPQRTPIEKRIAFIEIAGVDAGSFLNNLLSSSILELTNSNYISSAWHNQSGKVKCIVKIIKTSNCYVLAINKSIKQLITNQLLKYSLNLKVEILSNNDYVAISLLNASQWMKDVNPDFAKKRNGMIEIDGCKFLRVDNDFYNIFGKYNNIEKLIRSTLESITICDKNESIKKEISLGMANISKNIYEIFTPQMLNLDILQMIADGKGCYPGQEIINRINILGNTKRRIKYYIGKNNLKVKSMSEIVDLDNRKIGNLIRYVKIKNAYHMLAVVEVNRKYKEVFISNSKNYPIHEQEIKNTL